MATLTALAAAVSPAFADQDPIDGRKQARAARLTTGSIRLDGRLDEEIWIRAMPVTQFVQAEPVEGAAPTDAMEVRFVYDDTAMWIGARMFSSPDRAIQAPMSRRDDGEQAESPEFDPIDFGRLNYSGDTMGGPRVTFRETRPGRIFRAYSLGLNLNNYWYFDRNLGVRHTLGSSNSFTFNNFWVTSVIVSRYLRGLDAQLTRGGPAMGTPLGWTVSGSLRNSTGANTRWNGSGSVRSNEFGERAWGVGASVSARPSPAVQFSVSPEYLREKGTNATSNGPINRQYLANLSGGRPETYDRRYVFGLVDRTTVSTQLRVSYTFKPDMTLDVYAEPFAASGRYNGFGELAAARSRDLRMYGADGTTLERLADGSYKVTDGAASFTLNNSDFNVRSFRSNVVLGWEWRPGSTLFVVWQQNRSNTESQGDYVGAGDLFGSFSAPGDNIFAIKTTWWISP